MDVIIVGHTRYKAAIQLGMTEVPVHVAVGLTPAQAKAYRIADNQINRLSEWDQERLVVELMELQKLDFDLDLTGFSAEDLTSLLSLPNSEGQTDPDAIPDAKRGWIHFSISLIGANPGGDQSYEQTRSFR